MKPEYTETLRETNSVAEFLGFQSIENHDYLHVWRKEDKFVVLEGEPSVRGAFNLGIAWRWPTVPSSVLSIRILMRVFDDHSKPSLSNQLKFIETNIDALFSREDAYQSRYRAINGD